MPKKILDALWALVYNHAMRPIRERPAWQIKEMLKRAGVRQIDIARACDVEPSIVSLAINRVRTGSPATKERVWQEIERVTAKLFVEGRA